MKQCAILLLAAIAAAAQTPTASSFVGTVTGFRPESAQIEIRPDNGNAEVVTLTAETVTQKIAPGAQDLKNAEAIQVTGVAAGDRVLVTLDPGSRNARRIVVMSAGDIARRSEADRLDWQKRGVSGLVTAKSGKTVTVKTRSGTGEAEVLILITLDEGASLKRYAPDSVKFSDARPSRLSEISVGDQLRARGERSEDGHTLKAQEVVFGTFLVKAAVITAVNSQSRELSVKELGTNKPLTVVLTADSQIKQMPNMPGRGPEAPGPGGRAGIMPGRGGMMGGPPGGFDINQMLERLPPVKLEALSSGSTVVISSTKPVKSDQLTAILVLGNADMLIQMASAMSAGSRGGNGVVGAPAGPGAAGMGAGMMGGDPAGLGGLGLSGIIQ